MTFNYDDTLSADRDKIRHSIRDVTENEGILPGGKNFSDAEITFELTICDSWEYVVPKLLRLASNAWAARAAMLEEGSAHMEDTRSITRHLAARADSWEKDVLPRIEGISSVVSYEETTPTLPFYETEVTT